MNNKRRVYVYNGASGLGCLGLILVLALLIFLFIFFTKLFIQLFPTLLLILSIILLVRSIYNLWQWRKKDKHAQAGGFIEVDGVIEPIEAPDNQAKDYHTQRIFTSIAGIIIALLLMKYL